MASVFSTNSKSHLEKKIWLDEAVDIQRFDKLKYNSIDKLNENQISYFWQPQEVDLSKDKIDFAKLTKQEQHIFTSNLKRQILLDSVQGRAPNTVLGPIASLPEWENFITTWAFFEGSIHSRSYTHIIRNVYANPSVVFDEITSIQEIIDCADDISRYYDELDVYNKQVALFGYGTHNLNGEVVVLEEYEHKKKVWLCVNSINILEAVRFYVSFACSFAFGENKIMEGNAKIIRFISRDENLHMAATQMILRLMKREDPDFEKIAVECHDEVQGMFMSAIKQEEDWADYLFKDGSMIGLNAEILKQYTRYIGAIRMKKVDITVPYTPVAKNPIPWMDSWIESSTVQVAPQEVEVSSYVVGGISNEISDDSFDDLDFSL